MNMKRLVVLVMIVFVLLFTSCGGTENNASDNQKSFSCVGGWALDDEKVIFILEDGGNGTMVSIGTLTSDTGSSQVTTSSDLTWEDKGDVVTIKGTFGEKDFRKVEENGEKFLKTEKVTYKRLSDEKTEEYKNKNNKEPNAHEEEEETKSIPFSDTVVYEDDNLRVELDQFFEDTVHWAGQNEEVTEKYVSFKVINKGTQEFLFNVEDAYIGQDAMNVIMSDGNSGPAPGKAKQFSYDVQYDTKPESTPIDSLEQLYDLEGVFHIALEDGDYITDSYDVSFSIKSLGLR